MKQIEEWYFSAPFGKIALISYGNPKGEKVLLVHGRLDSAATFLPLLDVLPDKYYYVALDMPGHGRSDHLPKGVLANRFFPVTVVDMIIQYLGWKDFIYIGHSLGAEHGLFISSIYPGLIKKAIYLDIGASLHRYREKTLAYFFKSHFVNFYENQKKYNNDKTYSKKEAINVIIKSRFVNAEEAAVLLSRNLVEVGPDCYKLSLDRRNKVSPTFNVSEDFTIELLTINQPPTLFICANNFTSELYYAPDSIASRVMKRLSEINRNTEVMWVEGSHDIHFTNPKLMIDTIVKFMEANMLGSKL
ncbi:serine hydrolase-like protein isoform X4 [Leptidea sinapis]|uniref:serine hydrolase-like protein isoform X3 n=1 Tax=Leptidea sinapis TaxID=189913 RepID=UPI00212E72AE|nr:serine hydrolase-like protein isoform X3 [Leptidea sinapis]XP_050676514.1 serine hydrolase-like protein isoform X4 [Leptidea sinapis]